MSLINSINALFFPSWVCFLLERTRSHRVMPLHNDQSWTSRLIAGAMEKSAGSVYRCLGWGGGRIEETIIITFFSLLQIQGESYRKRKSVEAGQIPLGHLT